MVLCSQHTSSWHPKQHTVMRHVHTLHTYSGDVRNATKVFVCSASSVAIVIPCCHGHVHHQTSMECTPICIDTSCSVNIVHLISLNISSSRYSSNSRALIVNIKKLMIVSETAHNTASVTILHDCISLSCCVLLVLSSVSDLY
jgi:hypothetical protein